MADLQRYRVETWPGGMRRLWPVRCCLPQGRDTGFVREILAPGGARLERAADLFGTFQNLMALSEAGWLGNGRASMRLSLAESRERLCDLATRQKAIADVGQCRPGDPLVVTGRAQAVAPTSVSTLWHGEVPAGVSGYVETAYDFELACDAVHLRVRVDGAHLVAASSLVVGDEVMVVGFFDQQVDGAGARMSVRGEPLRNVVRSSSSLPLLVLAHQLSI